VDNGRVGKDVTINIDQWIDGCWCSSVLVFLGEERKKLYLK
jgi:hypothetical protein